MMKIVKVEYQVKSDFIETNKENIRKVMEAMKAKNSDTTNYASYNYGEGNFMHFTVTSSDNFSELTDLEAFKSFQKALKESEPIVPPKLYNLELVGSSNEVL